MDTVLFFPSRKYFQVFLFSIPHCYSFALYSSRPFISGWSGTFHSLLFRWHLKTWKRSDQGLWLNQPWLCYLSNLVLVSKGLTRLQSRCLISSMPKKLPWLSPATPVLLPPGLSTAFPGLLLPAGCGFIENGASQTFRDVFPGAGSCALPAPPWKLSVAGSVLWGTAAKGKGGDLTGSGVWQSQRTSLSSCSPFSLSNLQEGSEKCKQR